ncbi:AbrB/MazE/SpoVT family DNA-binding domain-containing protein [Planosporangium thailandense]|uniref:AbrB/MazE/SpoVT family DNA-binding domain-containing protein n=1 Tax=Planosporangium thailandense TaxID=765197 RepID=A0ABX0XUL2_9ACTN|nr:AbrB/MazE/SpoVT family DNA-binding domain-containing protein [Planosporangium thailandense]NJC69705.1 AbrB/MazE/SpoVT family DNA-binding domain-containing protein [Planosporangium thailandense]
MTKILESRVSAEGRVVIPADVRHQLGLEPGARVHFLVEEDGVRLVTAQKLAENVWARNTGGDNVDTDDVVRAAREQAEDRGFEWDERPLDTNAAGDDEDEVLASLFPVT